MTTTSTRRPPAMTGALSMTLEDGTVLTARTDVRLAEQWAEHQHGPTAWAALTFGDRIREVSAALTALRAAAADSELGEHHGQR